ncbi:hypothetical protein [Plantactinospora soyae]|uniref:Uncharacterized protein n=1 Tax=Plantactinospora soyae TaxID=1544732 RepID=A0A927MF19_9ACTN|nr:hypothetical protein [Plantactinospora soyae]MBE1489940.1 hypothetical protein [Plantactinospora soyae]
MPDIDTKPDISVNPDIGVKPDKFGSLGDPGRRTPFAVQGYGSGPTIRS